MGRWLVLAVVVKEVLTGFRAGSIQSDQWSVNLQADRQTYCSPDNVSKLSEVVEPEVCSDEGIEVICSVIYP